MDPSPREERFARNEALFRAANERMKQWEEQHADPEPELYFCECADTDCREKVALMESDYEAVRSDSRLFFVVDGHEQTDVEQVVARRDGWLIVEKPPEVDDVLTELDPRQP